MNINNRLLVAILISLSLLVAQSAQAEQPIVRVHLQDHSGQPRTAWPVTGGVPLPKGLVSDPSLLGLQGHPAQVRVLSRWSDGSIKWILLDYQVDLPANGANSQTIVLQNTPSLPNGNMVSENASSIVVDTGALKFHIAKDAFSFIDQAWLDLNNDGDYDDEGEQIIKTNSGQRQFFDIQSTAPARPAFSYRARNLKTGDSHSVSNSTPTVAGGPIWMRPGAGGVETTYVTGDLYSAVIKENGTLRAVIELKGRFHSTTANPWEGSDYSLWIHAYHGKSEIRVQHNFVLKGDPRHEFISRFGLQLPLDFASSATFTTAGLDTPQILTSDDTAYLFNSGPADVFHLYHQGFNLPWQVSAGTQSITGMEKTEGWIDVSSSRFGVTTVIRDMAYMYPKELSYDAGAKRLTAWLWPDHGGLVMDNNATGWTADPGKQGMQGMSFSHDILYSFYGPAGSAQTPSQVAALFNDPLQPYADPEWYSFRGTRAAGMIMGRDDRQFPGTEAFLATGNALLERSMTEYGWLGMLNYGDIMQDFSYNESGILGTWGLSDRPDNYSGWRHGNTMLSYRMFMQYLRTGNHHYWRAADSHLKHVRDVLIKHYNAFRDQLPGEIQWTGMGRRHSAYWGASTGIDQHGGVATDGYGSNWLGHYLHWNLTGDWRTYEVIREIRGAWNQFGANQWVAQLAGSAFVGLKLIGGIPGMEDAIVEADGYKTEAMRRLRDGDDEWRDCTWFFGYGLYLQDYPPDSAIKQAILDFWDTDPVVDQWGLFWHRDSLAAVYWAAEGNQPLRDSIYQRLLTQSTESNPPSAPRGARQLELYNTHGDTGLFSSDINELVAAVSNHSYWRIKDDIIQLQWDEPLTMAVIDHYLHGFDPVRAGDYDNSGFVELQDVVFCLRLTTGLSTSSEPNLKSDVNEDSRIGMAECIHALRVTGGLMD